MDIIRQILTQGLAEDIGPGDFTTLACINDTAVGRAQLVTRESGVLSGIDIARQVFELLDPDLVFTAYFKDGDYIKANDILLTVNGSAHAILKAERLVLNIMQRMSGIATKTARYVELVKGTGTTIIDTRKTTPNLRLFEKMAVRAGGGQNHRMGLYDMILIKDNHIDFAGGVGKAIKSSINYLQNNSLSLKIVVEVRNLNELEEVLTVGQINRILIDNFSLEHTRKAVKMVNGLFEIEASGGISETNIRQVALTGVNYISVGALTHHIRSLDMSLQVLK